MVILTPADRELAEEFDPEIAAELDDDEDEDESDPRWPKPTEMDVQSAQADIDAEWHRFLYGSGDIDALEDGDTNFLGTKGLKHIRDMRYQRDQLPQVYREKLSAPYRVRTRMTHNEILRAAALATRNAPRVRIDPASADDKAQRQATKETRFGNEILPFLERRANKPLSRIFVDSQFESGVAAWEVYQTDAYDNLPVREEGEDANVFNKRHDEAKRKAGFPLGVRPLDMMSCRYEEDEFGNVETCIIVEKKRRRRIQQELREDNISSERIEELMTPSPQADGDAKDDPSGGAPSGYVETVLYYDPVWTAYMVNGQFVEEPKPHGFPRTPIIPAWGQTTSSSRRDEKHQGITWGMIDLEQALNDLMTIDVDIAATFSRPKVGIETDIEGGQLRDTGGRPQVISLSGDGATELMPGQKFVNLFENFQSRVNPDTVSFLMAIWQRNGMNPISQGESPGADPSGFSVNTLQAAAQMMYEILLDNYARSVASLVDFIRESVKVTIGEPVFMRLPGDGKVEHLTIGPDDISDTPAEVSINAMNDVNMLAIRESFIAGNRGGYIKRERVQREGFGIEDVEAEDTQIKLDRVDIELDTMAWEEAKARVALSNGQIFAQMLGLPAPGAGGNAPPDPTAPIEPALDSTGGAPREPQAPTVGRELSNAQSGNEARARGGQQPGNQGTPRNRGA